ncbi:MAG TPA: SDR family oxidoreductase [Trebonia sp.]|jgi:NAD(P)-dependent dehydrogenase (short-subunit alcohol dehydrogenase family)
MTALPPGPLLPGAVCVVMGGSTGIGLAAAWALARHGSAVELAANDADGVHSAVSALRAEGYDAGGTVLDAARPEQIERFFAGVDARHGRLTALVNSAGVQRYGTAETTPVAVWDEVLNVNVRAMFLAAKHAVPLIRRGGGGAIVNVASAQATASQRNVVAYTASKGAIVAMTRAMAVDHAPDGIRVNSVSPGSVDTPMLRAAARDVSADDPEAVIAGWGAQHPIGRVGTPAEIADAIVFLASPMSSFVTGADLRVDGGVLAGVALPAPTTTDT